MPDAGDDFDLKAVVRPIILAQGNKYIKELLRKHKIKIGLNKADFEKNLYDAIDQGLLTREMVEEWLLKVDGWGDQHVYLLSVPQADVKTLEDKIRSSKHAGLVGAQVGYGFPDELSLTVVRLDNQELSADWHIGSGGWERAKSRDYQAEIEGDLFEYRAYRERSDRSVVRFEWQFAKPYSALFTQLPNDGDLHPNSIKRVFEDLAELGIAEQPLAKVTLTKAVKASSQDELVTAHSTKMSADGGFVALVATSTDHGIGDVEALRRVRRGVQDNDFGAAEGMLTFRADKQPDLSRDIKATVYGSDGRFRVWVQCKRDDIYTIADSIWRKNA